MKAWIDDVLPLVANGHGVDPLGTDDLTTHRIPLSDARAYGTFQEEDGAVKVVFKP